MVKAKGQRKSVYTDAERERAATIIQAFYRGYRVRKQQKIKEKADSSPTKSKASRTMLKILKIGAPLAVGVGAVVATPVVIGALGFGTTGIVAGSVAAKGMSLAATSGVGMSVISTCQSIGAVAALSGSQAVAVGSVTTAASAAVGKMFGWMWKK